MVEETHNEMSALINSGEKKKKALSSGDVYT